MRKVSKLQSLKASKLIKEVMIKKLVRHKDERGFFEELIRYNDPFFKEGFGQLSHSFMYAEVVKAWHIHKTQTDWWFVSRGDLKVVLCDQRRNSSTYGNINEFMMGEHGEDMILKIPPQVAHGCKVLGSSAELFYITSGVYNPEEEGRIPPDDPHIGYDWLKIPEIK